MIKSKVLFKAALVLLLLFTPVLVLTQPNRQIASSKEAPIDLGKFRLEFAQKHIGEMMDNTFSDQFIDAIYLYYLNRQPDDSGRIFWRTYFRNTYISEAALYNLESIFLKHAYEPLYGQPNLSVSTPLQMKNFRKSFAEKHSDKLFRDALADEYLKTIYIVYFKQTLDEEGRLYWTTALKDKVISVPSLFLVESEITSHSGKRKQSSGVPVSPAYFQ